VTKFKQNIVSVRFLEVLDELIDKQIVNNTADFCRRAGYSLQSMTKIKNGQRDVTLDLVGKLFTMFNGSPIYLLSGKGSKLLTDRILSHLKGESSNAHHDDQPDTQTLEELIESKNVIISLLQKDNIRLENELKKRIAR
jgi:hypothetical protein